MLHTLKFLLCKEPILQLPDPSRQFTLRMDASSEALDAVLMLEINGDIFPVAYYSKKMKQAERNYSTVERERELLAVVDSVKKFCFYQYGDDFTVQTEHIPIESLRTSKNANAWIRWEL